MPLENQRKAHNSDLFDWTGTSYRMYGIVCICCYFDCYYYVEVIRCLNNNKTETRRWECSIPMFQMKTVKIDTLPKVSAVVRFALNRTHSTLNQFLLFSHYGISFCYAQFSTFGAYSHHRCIWSGTENGLLNVYRYLESFQYKHFVFMIVVELKGRNFKISCVPSTRLGDK